MKKERIIFHCEKCNKPYSLTPFEAEWRKLSKIPNLCSCCLKKEQLEKVKNGSNYNSNY